MKEKLIYPFDQQKLLLLLALIFTLKGIFYAAYVMPLRTFTSPDDVGHISYIIYLSTMHDRPILGSTKLEKTVAENCYDWDESKEYKINTEKYDESERLNWIAQHPPLYYFYLLPFYKITTIFSTQLSDIILILRMATIPLGIITLLFLLKTLELLGAGKITTKCALICFSFSSAIQYYFTAIDNDAMVICISSAAFYYFIKFLKNNSNKNLYIFAALCGGITVTKYTGAIVLPVYVLFYIYYAVYIKKVNITRFIKSSFISITIFCIITVPVLLDNYAKCGSFFSNAISTLENNSDGTLVSFVKGSYFNEIFTHIISLTGWERMIAANEGIKALVVLVILCIFFAKISHYMLQMIPFMAATFLMKITGMNVLTAIGISAVLMIMIQAIRNGNKCNNSRYFYLLSFCLISFFVSIFFWKHYQIFLQRGRTSAMHGRYYYPLMVPFFSLLFEGLDNLNDKTIKYMPMILFCTSLYTEVNLICQGMQTWY